MILAAIAADAGYVPSHTEAFFPSRDEPQAPHRPLFTPFRSDGEKIMYAVKSLRDYATEIQRPSAVDYPARGHSTYYQPKVVFHSDEDGYAHERPVIVEKIVKESYVEPTYVKKVVPVVVKEHLSDGDNDIVQYYGHDKSQYSDATSVSQTVYEGSNARYSW